MDIDFEEASNEWRKNKINMGNGYFKYKCKLCNNELYKYVFENKLFDNFATDFDRMNKNNPDIYLFCEDHILNQH